jgi:transposase
MATATATRSTKTARKKKTRYIGKPTGVIQGRVEAAGPSRFAVISVDCAKRRSKWMLCDFFGKVIVEPTDVQHDAGSLSVMCQQIKEALWQHNIVDSIAAVEMTGVYHRPVQGALRKAGLDTRTVHPFASKHYRKVLHPDLKTDDNDLEAIFHAAINGYGLASLPVDANYRSLQSLVRHRGNLVKQRSRLQVQIRNMMHQCMPGYDELFVLHKFFKESVAMPVAEKFSSAKAIERTGIDGIAEYLKKQKVRSHRATLEKIVAWSKTAADPAELAGMMTEQWRGLSELRKAIDKQIVQAEREMARFLVKTPYVLMLSIRGINVVSASTLAGEAGPIEHYASARAINGRAGLFPSRYQSDTVDSQGRLSRGGNRRLSERSRI